MSWSRVWLCSVLVIANLARKQANALLLKAVFNVT